MIVRGFRPSIPAACPSGLATLIRLCWQDDAPQRPPWDNIIVCLLNLAHSLNLADQILIPGECFESRGTRRAAERLRSESFSSSSTSEVTRSTRTSSSTSIPTEIDMMRRRSSSADRTAFPSFGTLSPRAAEKPTPPINLPLRRKDVIAVPLRRASISSSDQEGSEDLLDSSGSTRDSGKHSGSFLCRGRFVASSKAATAVVQMAAVSDHPIIWVGCADGTVAVWSATVRFHSHFSVLLAGQLNDFMLLAWTTDEPISASACRKRWSTCKTRWDSLELF
jgi:hypothetical protein